MTHAFQSLSIGTRLGAGFALLVGLLFVTAGTSAYQARQMATNARHYADNLVPSYEAEHAVAMSLANARGYASQHVLFRDNEQMDRVEKRLKQERTIAAQQLQRFRGELVSDPADLSLLDATEKAWQHNIKLEDQILDASRAKTYDESKGFEAQALLLGDGRQAYEQAEQALQAWWDHKVTLAAQSAQASEQTYRRAWMTLCAGTLLAALLGVVAAINLTRSITRPVAQALNLANNVADGDLTAHIVPQSQHEVGQLLHALARMNTRLVDIVTQVRHSSLAIASGSTHIAQGNGELNQRTEQQASALQQTAATMDQLGATVRQNADHARQASTLSQDASTVAQQGGEVIAKVVKTMQAIHHSADRITDIISVVDGIAFQTNILALNAAVEAARAGEQGRGFAVVAAEVRSLAQRSANAAKEIKTLITNCVEQTTQGSTLVEEAGQTMGKIVTAIQHVNDIVGDISEASAQQAQGILQMGQAVAQVEQLTQHNASLVDASFSAADNLRQQSAQLVHTVAVFKLGSGVIPKVTA